MTIDKITSAPSPNEQIKKINEIIDAIPTVNNATITITQGGVTKGSFTTDQSNDATIALDGGSGGSTDVRINGTSITSNNVADIKTNGVYNESTNKIATMHDLSGKANDSSVVHLTGDETISGTKTFTYDTKYKIGSSNKYGVIGNSALGFNVSAPSDVDLALGGSNLDFWTSNSSGYRLLIGSTGKIPNARINMDSAPTQNSTNTVTSGGVYDEIQSVKRNIGEIVQSTIPLSDAGLHLLDGSLIYGNGIYADFVDHIYELYDNKDMLYAFQCSATGDIYYTKTTTLAYDVKIYDSHGVEVGYLQQPGSSYPKFVWDSGLGNNSFIYEESSGTSLGFTRNSSYDTKGGIFCSETEWQESVTNYGACGKFVYDSTDNTVRLPRIVGFTESAMDSTTIGELTEAGLPNITGQITTSGANLSAGTGALYRSGSSVVNRDDNLDTSGYRLLNIDASRSSTIYGNSTTVQPQSVKVLYYIVVANSTKTEIEVDIDNVATELNLLSNNYNYDGRIVVSYLEAYNSTLANGSSTNIDLSSYLPNDNYSYFIAVECSTTTGSTSGNGCNCCVFTGLLPSDGFNIVGVRTRASSTMYNYGTALIPVDASRSMSIKNTANASGTITLRFMYYRRIGTNT